MFLLNYSYLCIVAGESAIKKKEAFSIFHTENFDTSQENLDKRKRSFL
jgi:hypothetical protein